MPLGDGLGAVGDGHRKIGLKADAILPYKYHLALGLLDGEGCRCLSRLRAAIRSRAAPDLARWFPDEASCRSTSPTGQEP